MGVVGEAGGGGGLNGDKKTVSNNCNITVLYDCEKKIVILLWWHTLKDCKVIIYSNTSGVKSC